MLSDADGFDSIYTTRLECVLNSASHLHALRDLVVASLDADKAEDIVAIDLAGKTAIADYMCIASGRSHRHVRALAEHLLRKLKAFGVKGARIEGLKNCDWVLIDTGDVLVHIFRPEVRVFYDLEKMWVADFDTETASKMRRS